MVAVTVVVPPLSAATTLTEGLVTLVTLSVPLEPESSPIARSGVPGADGAVLSRVIVVDAEAAEPGPEFPAVSSTDVTFRRGWTVPSEVHVAVTVKLVPDEALTPNEHDAVPAFSKSLPANPDTAASIDNVNATDAELVGDDTADENDDTDGAVVSIVIDTPDDADDTLPAESVCVAVIE